MVMPWDLAPGDFTLGKHYRKMFTWMIPDKKETKTNKKSLITTLVSNKRGKLIYQSYVSKLSSLCSYAIICESYKHAWRMFMTHNAKKEHTQ